MKLRDATPDDAARLEEIRVAAWLDAYAGKAERDVFDVLTNDPDGGVQVLREMIEGGHAITSIRVVEEGRGIKGFCAVAAPSRDGEEPEGVAEIVALYVEPESHRRGYGRALLDDAVERLGTGVWREATVWTLEDNFRSLPLYESRGFKPDGSMRTDRGWFVADVRLRKSLAGQSG
ncbi:MAG: GNAT family N-acetyltransferase [Solirubrobacterales bacterium]